MLYHDGPPPELLRDQVQGFSDDRVQLFHTSERFNDWGHTLRELGLAHVGDADFVVHTNADNYYAPAFIKQMMEAFTPDTVMTYCDMVHSHYGWNLIRSKLELGSIDCGAVMLRALVAVECGWRSREFAADWVYIASVLKLYPDRSIHVPRPLFVHN